MVGGTGLYFKTLTQGLAAVPPIPARSARRVRERLARDGVAPLYAELDRRDPATAQRLMPGDRSRIARALEVVEATGRSLTDWHREGMKPVLDPAARGEGLSCRPIATGSTARSTIASTGCSPPARSTRSRRWPVAVSRPMLPAMKAHGVPWLIRHLNGEITLAEAAEGGKRDTRRYTKRQATWFRNQLPDWTWVAPEIAAAEILRALGALTRRLPPPPGRSRRRQVRRPAPTTPA